MCKKVNRSDKPTDIHPSLQSALKSFIVSLFSFYGPKLYSFCFSLTALINFVSRLQLIFRGKTSARCIYSLFLTLYLDSH